MQIRKGIYNLCRIIKYKKLTEIQKLNDFLVCAIGYGPELLYFGGGYATLHTFDDPRLYSAKSFYGDHEDDHYNIEYGINWYKELFSNDKPIFNPSIKDLETLDVIKKTVFSILSSLF